MALPHEHKDSKEHGIYRPVQVFAPDVISADQASHDVTNIIAVRTTSDGTYYLNAASGATAFAVAGTIIGIAGSVTTLVFAAAQILEMMSAECFDGS